MSDDRRVDGIDVSHYQQGEEGYRPEWSKVLTDQRIRFIAVKATQGLTAIDSEFKANIAELRTLVPHPNGSPGSPWLAWYHFRTNEDTVGQCSHFRQVVGPLRDGEGIVLDCEGNTSGTYGDQRAICEIAGRMFDRIAIRYGGDTAWTFPNQIKWAARYRASKPTYPCSLWQFGAANVPGITGVVDANRILDEADLARAFRPVSDPTPVEEDDMTPEQSKKLDELHTAMMAGWPAYGTQPVAKEVSRIGRMVRNLAVKAGIQVEPADA